MRQLILLLAAACLAISTGCATLTVELDTPQVSSIRYTDPPDERKTLAVTESRSQAGQKMSKGLFTVRHPVLDQGPMPFLSRHIVSELQARRIKLEGAPSPAELNLKVTFFQIRNHRATGFSPYYTFTKFSALLDHAGEEHLITAYFKTGKVPVWTFNEVIEPTYNIPFSMIIKEIASKLNRIVYGAQADSATIARILAAIEADSSNLVYQKVFELGYTNNPEAIPHLRKIAITHRVALARAAAISSLGILKASGEFDFLKSIYNSKNKIEKVMALKSIGDLNTPDSNAFVEHVSTLPPDRDGMITDVIDLHRRPE